MRLRTSTIHARHLTSRCVACGAPCQPAASRTHCGRCGCDLLERPARSYAEMEGLVEHGDAHATTAPPDALRLWRDTLTLERWLLTAFTAAVLLAFGAHAVGSLLSA